MSVPKPQASDFRDLFPEFTEADYPDALVERWIETAGYIHSVTLRGWLFLTAHLLSIAKSDGALDGVATPDQGQGLLRVERLGEKRKEYSYSSDSMEFYDRTSYGRMFRQLDKRVAVTGIAARVF